MRKERGSAIKINPCSISLSVTGEQKSPVILAHSVIPAKGTKQLELKHNLASICKYCIEILKTFTFKTVREFRNRNLLSKLSSDCYWIHRVSPARQIYARTLRERSLGPATLILLVNLTKFCITSSCKYILKPISALKPTS